MKKYKVVLIALVVFSFFGLQALTASESGKIPYLDRTLSVEDRIDDLMSRMTLEEKIAQMCQYVGIEHMKQAERNLTKEEMQKSDAHGFYPDMHSSDVARMTEQGLIGSFLHVVTAEEANYLQSLAQKSRLKIPLIIGIDAIHGNALCRGTTVYPTPIGLASTWDPALVERIGHETALETRATGAHWSFTPNVDVARDPRWGRVGETFGEDPHLVSLMGEAMIRGMQGDGYTGFDAIIACAKHYIAGSQPENGLNFAPTDISERTLKEVFLPPYKRAVDAGVYSIMAAHNEINGIPCHANVHLNENILRSEFGFKGFIVSDWMDIERLHDLHLVAVDQKHACLLAIEAGIDMHMHGPDFLEPLKKLVKEGQIAEERIDLSVRRVLEAKFKLGLFEDPYVNIEKSDELLFNDNHKATALEAARKSIVLLTNRGFLPIDSKKIKRIFVTGPNANNETILGDWSLRQPEENVITIFEGLKAQAPQGVAIDYFDCGEMIMNLEDEKIKKAGALAKSADLAIVVVGENSLRYLWNNRTCGENIARSEIDLSGKQLDLVKEIHQSGTPFIVVLVNGRQLGIPWVVEHAAAVIETWEPGLMGGQALAEIVYGQINPSGKMPVTVPRSSGHIVSVYNHKNTNYKRLYVDVETSPLFSFGYGLSYSTFTYHNLILEKAKIATSDSVKVNVDVTNNSDLKGDEIVQLYIRDLVSSVTRPVKELKAFERISLERGETKNIQFIITPEKLKFYDINMNYRVEEGEFNIMVGGSSRDEDLLSIILTVE